MKKILLTALLVSVYAFSQKSSLLYDQHFIKADDIEAYDKLIEEKFLPYNQARKDNGDIVEFSVWKVIHNPSEDFTHMVTFIYDMDNKDVVDEDFDPLKEINTSEEDWRRFQKEANQVRTLVYRHKWNNLKSISKKDIDLPANIMVLNFMKLKDDKWGSYEQAEVNGTKSISKNSPRVGWTFHRRLDNYGTDIYYTHTTIDWFNSYPDFIRINMGGVSTSDIGEKGIAMNKLRDLRRRVILYKAYQSK